MIYWRARIQIFILLIFVFFGFLTCIQRIQFSLKHEMFRTIIPDAILFFFILLLFLTRRSQFKFRALATILISYCFGLTLILPPFPVGTGFIWLFTFPILAVVLFNQRFAYYALFWNSTTLVVIGIYYFIHPEFWEILQPGSMYLWIIIGMTYLFLNIIATMSVARILNGLAVSLKKEKHMQENQKTINEELLKTNKKLVQEMNDKQSVENNLLQKNSELNSLINTIPDMIWLKDEHSNYITANNAFYKTTDSTPNDVINGTGIEFFGDETTRRYILSDKLVMETRVPLILEENDHDSDGRDIWFETIKAPIINSHGVCTGTVGIAHDITKRKGILTEIQELNNNLETKIEKRTRELLQANKRFVKEIDERKKLQSHLLVSERFAATGQLASSIAHEINSPLQGIISLLNVIEKTHPGDRELIENIKLINGAFIQIRNTVGNLQDLNRPSENVKRVVNINTIIIQSASLLKSYLKKNRIKLSLLLSENILPARVSAQEINQCLVNLVNNSVEAITGSERPYMDTMQPIYMGEIFIQTANDNEHLIITIRDTGPGIKGIHLDNIFDPFYTCRKKSGMGIGLSICHQIMENHNGSITASNSKSGGAVFQISIPAEEN